MTTFRKTKRYGWLPDLYDVRDRIFNQEERILSAHKVPGKVDPLTSIIPRWDQGQLGSCEGHGNARVYAYEAYKQGEGIVTPSRLFIYGNARKIEGTYSSDSGAMTRDAIKGMVEYGAPPEALWPYSAKDPGQFNQLIPQSVYDAGKEHLALQYQSLRGGPGAPFRTAIASGLPFVFGFTVPSFFEDQNVWDPATQVLPMPSRDDQPIGGHCVVADGYDFTCSDFPDPFFWVPNSWSEEWGANAPNGDQKGGYFRMHAHYVPGIASDFWVIQKTS